MSNIDSIKINMTYKEFIHLEESTKDEYYEYDGYKAIKLATPTEEHQRVSSRLANTLYTYFDNTKCFSYAAPIALMYNYLEKGSKGKQVLPDLMVTCDNEFYNSKYYGVPVIVVEIISPSTGLNDFNSKKDLYERLGVREYWIVDLYSKEVWMYNLDVEDFIYRRPIIFKGNEIIISQLFEGLSIECSKLFAGITKDKSEIRNIYSKIIPFTNYKK